MPSLRHAVDTEPLAAHVHAPPPFLCVGPEPTSGRGWTLRLSANGFGLLRRVCRWTSLPHCRARPFSYCRDSSGLTANGQSLRSNIRCRAPLRGLAPSPPMPDVFSLHRGTCPLGVDRAIARRSPLRSSSERAALGTRVEVVSASACGACGLKCLLECPPAAFPLVV